MKYFLYIILILFTLIPLFSESILGKRGRLEFLKLFRAELSASSEVRKEKPTSPEKKVYEFSQRKSSSKVMEEDFDDQENSDEEQENEEIEEEA